MSLKTKILVEIVEKTTCLKSALGGSVWYPTPSEMFKIHVVFVGSPLRIQFTSDVVEKIMVMQIVFPEPHLEIGRPEKTLHPRDLPPGEHTFITDQVTFRKFSFFSLFK